MVKQIALHIDSNYQRQSHICRNLESLGFEVFKSSDIKTATTMVRKYRYRLLLINFDTAGKEIFKFCSFLKTGSPHTIIMVIMSKPMIKAEEQLFDCDVNDVITGKQAMPRILAKRIRARLHNSKMPPIENNSIRLKDTIIDFDRREVWCNGITQQLPGILADLLKYFLNNPERIISRDELLNCHIWSDSICSSASEGGKTFDANMSKLRKIIETTPTEPQIIQSVRGEGWKLAKDLIG
jgi:two-component system, OmpR family, alkaline phosphatase synthesis response regulator PhoP